jgi:hypothetical protein
MLQGWFGCSEPADRRDRLSWLQSGIFLAMSQDSGVARTIRFPAALREKITTDAERCGRSFDGQVIALLRRHYALATASLADIPVVELRSLTRRLQEPES